MQGTNPFQMSKTYTKIVPQVTLLIIKAIGGLQWRF